MSKLEYLKHEPVSLKKHPEYNEKWLQERIREDPSILGLGELEVKDVERSQPNAGRIDMILRDPETTKRYEVEIMLGAVDESHIIRTIEYWNIERKRYPQYDHCAVIIAENITSRFHNVIGLFNSAIPIVAIQLNALKVQDKLILNFTKVLDEIVLGTEEEEDSGGKSTDRSDWERKLPKGGLDIVDECLRILSEIDPELAPNYQANYIGLTKGTTVRNFVVFRPKKQSVRTDVRISDQTEWIARLEEAGIVVYRSPKVGAWLIFYVEKDDIAKNQGLIKELFEAAYKEAGL